jgi:3-oxoacyl-[acyl-carrier protein] reductase
MKNIIVTGGTRGIGRAIVETLAKKSLMRDSDIKEANFIVTYRSGVEQAKTLAAELRHLGISCQTLEMDLASTSSIDAFVTKIAQQVDHIDVLINNGGMTNDGSFLTMSDLEVGALLDTNLIGTMYLSESLVPLLQRAPTSSVIFIASAAGVYGKEGQVPYATTKGGLIGYCQLLARRFGRNGMYVNAVAPGFIETDMVKSLDPSMFEHTLKNASIGAMGSPVDVANVVHSLLTPGYIQATTIKVDGGHLR